jgi:hypothetical protein
VLLKVVVIVLAASTCCSSTPGGYGGNSGRPTEAGLARDVRAARQLLVDRIMR